MLNRRALTLATALVTLSMLACSDLPARLIRSAQLSGASGPVETPPAVAQPIGTTAPGAATATVARPVAQAATAAPQPSPTVVATPTRRAPNPAMIGIRTGLGSLNSYQFTYRTISSGPTPADRSEMTLLSQNDNAKKASRVRMEMLSASENEKPSEADVSETITVGNQQCEISGKAPNQKGTLSENSALQSEMASTLPALLDFTLTTDNPLFVAEETVNGIPVNHFSFKLAGLGKESGAVVRANKGDYWLARDGQYLVKYALNFEVASAAAGSPQAQVYKGEVTFDLTNINAPLTIAIPVFCKK